MLDGGPRWTLVLPGAVLAGLLGMWGLPAFVTAKPKPARLTPAEKLQEYLKLAQVRSPSAMYAHPAVKHSCTHA